MLDISQVRRSALQTQQVTQCHLNTARIIVDTTGYTRLIQPFMQHPNDITTFDITDEQHRL